MIHEKTTANAEARKAAHADETPVEPHAHGGDLLRMAEAAGRDPASLLDFSVNVRPEGPPEFIRRALFRAMNALEAYPSPHAEEACRAAARHHGLDAARFVFGNGSNELIHALARALKKRGVPGVYIVEPAFSEYALACRCAGLEVRRVWGGIAGENLGEGRGNLSEERLPTPSKDFYEGKDDQQVPEGTHSGFPQDAPEGWAVFLANPGNPSGLFRNAEDCLDLMRSRHDLLWIIDEAFIEYAGPEEEVSVLRRLPANGAALRSLTKFHAVPGVRLGYLAASPDVAEAVRAEIPAWSVNAFALAAALAVFA
ncbi:aminotransferase class I/II-fold pyridoxal phosphate-dependent enzyme, partial [uncultured Bilophila sp.]